MNKVGVRPLVVAHIAESAVFDETGSVQPKARNAARRIDRLMAKYNFALLGVGGLAMGHLVAARIADFTLERPITGVEPEVADDLRFNMEVEGLSAGISMVMFVGETKDALLRDTLPEHAEAVRLARMVRASKLLFLGTTDGLHDLDGTILPVVNDEKAKLLRRLVKLRKGVVDPQFLGNESRSLLDAGVEAGSFGIATHIGPLHRVTGVLTGRTGTSFTIRQTWQAS